MTKFFNKLQKSEEGFTLVELMVVVAIIGILAAVAIPNFRTYQAKSRTSDAKLVLSAVYMAQETFFGDAGRYATCLNAMGYEQPGESYYAHGFSAATAASATVGGVERINGVICDDQALTSNDGIANNADDIQGGLYPASRGIGGAIVADLADCAGASTVATPNTYSACAVGTVSGDFVGVNASSWSINDSKLLVEDRRGY